MVAIPFNAYQPGLVLNETIALNGIFPPPDGDSGGMTLGMFHTYAFNFGLGGAPTANGQILSISSNTALFSILGTTYGGNGQTTFALPNLTARTSVSDGQAPGLSLISLGEARGVTTASLTIPQLPASIGGTSAPVDEDQPELGVKYMIRDTGIFPPNGGSGVSLDFIGSVVKFAGNFAPGGYLECNGQLLDIASHETLFNIIGTTYGGDGQTTFAVPDLRGRTIVGAGGSYVVGESFGQEDELISQSNLPVAMGGGGQPMNNVEPSLAMTYAIALTGIFPSRDGSADPYTPMLGEIIAFAGNYPPGGFALCQGQLLPINQNQALFALLGTQFGGNGQTNFALPDLRGRTVLGLGDGNFVGETAGVSDVTLTLDSLPDLNYSGTNAGQTHYGANGNDTISGLGGDDTLVGNGGNDRLIGGTGADAMTGGLGNDTYYVDNALDTVNEATGGGFDVVLSSVNYALQSGQEVDRLSTTAVASTSAINLTGNDFANQIYGNNGGNVINGLGGADLATGYGGNDSYFVDNALDAVIEAVGGGFDIVYASVNFTLAAGQEIERLSTTNYTLTNAINLTGNDIANQIYGNNGTNVINGGLGNDLMTGFGGIDTYQIDAAGDLVIEAAGGGFDIVVASVSYILGAGQEIERLTTANAAATTAINLTGNAIVNQIYGNSGANIINGGLGNDVLNGLGGADNFLFNTALNAANNHDTMTDFTIADDTIQLENAIFTALVTGGALAANLFEANSIAGQSGSEVIIYDRANGDLYYDTNGAATAGGLILFADVTNNTALTNADFVVV